MTTLTLKIDRRVVSDAEVYAKHTQKTVSQLVEDFLLSLSSSDNSDQQPAVLPQTAFISQGDAEMLGPITKRLTGIVKLNSDVDHKELLTEILTEKYL